MALNVLAGTVGWTPRASRRRTGARRRSGSSADRRAGARDAAHSLSSRAFGRRARRHSPRPSYARVGERRHRWRRGLVAFGTSGLILYQKGVRDDNCDAQKVCTARGFAASQTIQTLVPWNTGSWIVAAVGVGAGVGLWFASRDDRKQTAISVSPAPGGVAIGVRSTF